MAESTEIKEDVFLQALTKHLPPIGTDITKTSLWPRVKPGHASAVQLAMLVRQETQMKLLMRVEQRLAEYVSLHR
jgi:hypothetical protein